MSDRRRFLVLPGCSSSSSCNACPLSLGILARSYRREVTVHNSLTVPSSVVSSCGQLSHRGMTQNNTIEDINWGPSHHMDTYSICPGDAFLNSVGQTISALMRIIPLDWPQTEESVITHLFLITCYFYTCTAFHDFEESSPSF